jgi:CubicO group peptidase (beta-lactamase class C family)
LEQYAMTSPATTGTSTPLSRRRPRATPIAVAAILLFLAASLNPSSSRGGPAVLGAAVLEQPAIPEAKDGNPTDLGLAGYAKVLCSALFVSNREQAEATLHARTLAVALLGLPKADGAKLTETIDRDNKLVRASIGSHTRTARFYGDQGCIIHPADSDKIFFKPVPVVSRLPHAATQPWPMGDAPSAVPPPADVDMARVNKAVDLVFANPEAQTTGFIVVYRGRILAERYAPGITKDTQLESWSMGKSLTATLVGRLIQDGHFGINDPAPVPEWQQPGDARAKIRVADLLRMSSGLRFTRDMGGAYPDHFFIYTGAIDAFRYSVSRPLEFSPNTEGRYRNCDPLTLGYIVKRTVTDRGEEYLTYPQRELFDQIGIRRQVLETDPYGNFLLTGYDYGTARNWARIGLLYLNDGMWQGKRLIPKEFVAFVRTLAPAWKAPSYGGQFWVNGNDAWNLPRDAYLASGSGGQHTFIVPSHDLVMVRMGHHAGGRASRDGLRAAQKEILAALPAKQTSNASAPANF